jgi:D-alanine-D-alanine ligase
MQKRTAPSALKVLVLYNLSERLQKGEEKDILAEDAVLEEIGAVEGAIRELGHRYEVMAIPEDLFALVGSITNLAPDVIFNLCESVFGNSCWEMHIPALLELLRIPYTGAPSLTLGLCQDKGKVKDILLAHGILTPRYQIWRRLPEGSENGGFPKIVKPLHEDGSLGISRESVVHGEEALKDRIRYVIEKYGQPALVEEYVEGRELNVSLLEAGGTVRVLPVSEIDYSGFPDGVPRICGYEAKWVSESVEYQKSTPVCPASLDPDVLKEIEVTALNAYGLFECRDYARIDFRLDADGRPFVLEVNPNPDISPQSGMTRSIQAAGMTYAEFVGLVLEEACRRKPCP